MRPPRSRSLAPGSLLPVLLGCLWLAGCGAGDPAPADSPSAATPAPATPPPAPTPPPGAEALLAATTACTPSTHTIEQVLEAMGLTSTVRGVFVIESGTVESCRVSRTFQPLSVTPSPALVEAAASDPMLAAQVEAMTSMSKGQRPPPRGDVCEGPTEALLARFAQELEGIHRSSSQDPLCRPTARP